MSSNDTTTQQCSSEIYRAISAAAAVCDAIISLEKKTSALDSTTMHALRYAAMCAPRLGDSARRVCDSCLGLHAIAAPCHVAPWPGRRAQVFDSRDAPRARFSAPECLKFSTDRGPRSPDISAPTLPGNPLAFRSTRRIAGDGFRRSAYTGCIAWPLGQQRRRRRTRRFFTHVVRPQHNHYTRLHESRLASEYTTLHTKGT